jgi:PAS domain S-box-containing protein
MDHPQVQANVRRALAGERFTAMLDLDGHIFECAYGPVWDADGLLDGAVGVGTDVTEREAARRDLERLQHEHQLILQSAGEGIYGQNCQGLTTFVNPAAARMLGWSAEELIGRDMHAILHGTRADGSPYPREECPIHTAVADGGVHHATGELFWRQDGQSFPVEYICAPVHDGCRVVGAVVTFNDISRRRAAEEERARLYGKLLERDRELQEAVSGILLAHGSDPGLCGQGDELARLTRREREVLLGLTQGQTNAEIARALGLGAGTIKSHVEHLLKKLGLDSRTQAAVWAARLNPAALSASESVPDASTSVSARRQ